MSTDSTEEAARAPVALHQSPRSVKSHLTPLTLLILVVGFLLGAAVCYRLRDFYIPRDLQGLSSKGAAGCANHCARIGAALEAYAQEHGSYPASQWEVVPAYLKSLPDCPSAGRMTYRTSYSADGKSFLVECCGRNHGDTFVARNYPAYDSSEGLRIKQRW